jgi:hypothetical protein
MQQIVVLSSMLMIGGSGRNVGKTTLICAIIRKLAPTTPIIGLKVTSMRAGEEDFHGHHESQLSDTYKIIEETGSDSRKDTAKMLQSGAKKVYFVQCVDGQLQQAMDAFFELEDRNSVIICETRNLRRIIKPGVFILITDPAHDNFKADCSEFINSADLHLKFDHTNRTIESNAEKIILENGIWQLAGEK